MAWAAAEYTFRSRPENARSGMDWRISSSLGDSEADGGDAGDALEPGGELGVDEEIAAEDELGLADREPGLE